MTRRTKTARKKTNDLTDFEKAAKAAAKTRQYVLRLYVAGTTPRSERAIRSVKDLCEERLQGRYHLEVVDIYQQPGAAKDEQVIVAPTLIKQLPLPLRRLIGDMANQEKLILGLDLRAK